MNLLDVLKSPSPTGSAPTWRGTWARLWLQPSVFSAQKFVVGLAVLDERGLCDFCFITGTDKFECVYVDPAVREMVDAILAEGRQRLGAARHDRTPITTEALPPGLELEPVGYVADTSARAAMETALNEAEIPMEPRPDLARSPRFKSRSAADVVEDVLNAVKQKMGLPANELIRTDRFGDDRHIGAVNLMRHNAAGIVASGWYASSERVQLELLKAANMVETYMSVTQKTGRAGLFLLRPTTESGLSAKQSQDIENGLDQLDWRLSKLGLQVGIQDRESALAEDVAEWAAG